MSQTITAVGDPKAVKRWATSLARDYAKQRYFHRFIGRSDNSIIEEKIELAQDAGDRITFDLSMRLRKKPVFGDNRAEGKEEALSFYSDEVLIDQVRKPVSAGGRMTRKRTIHDYRKIARDRNAEFMAEWTDELFFVYLSGGLGANEDAIVDAAFAGNSIQAPDDAHIMYGGDATSKATIASADTMTWQLVQRAATHAKMMNATDPSTIAMRPIRIDSAEHFVCLMSPWQAHDMKSAAGDNTWAQYQRAAAGAEGRRNAVFTGALGMIDNVVLHEHSNVRRSVDYGAGANLPAARALFMGRQAGVVAYGTPGKTRMSWVEKKMDYDNEVAITVGCIFGMKKTRFNNRDFGVVAIDTHSANPN